MRLRSNKHITNINNSIMSLESSIEVTDSDSDIDDAEVEALKHEMNEFMNKSTPSSRQSTQNSNTLINLSDSLEDLDSESNDEDYNPFVKNEHKEHKEHNEHNSLLKTISKYFVFTEEDKRYFSKLDNDEKDKIIELKNKIDSSMLEKKPSLFKILECKLPLDSKIEILKKYKESRMMESSSNEFFKLQEYINGILKIPFNKFNDLNIENTAKYITESKNSLNSIIYGHDKVKLHILEILGQYISAPKSIGNVFGIYGPMGIGKTTIIKDGLSGVLQRPFNFITLGGASDASFLDGHSYTYEGARHGKIIECLIKSKCMNPIFYFDELDKISNTAKGEELTNLLIHLTDDSQNNKFQDKYYTGIDIDVSRAIFVFSFNNLSRVNPILRDRLNLIRLDGFNGEDKFTISTDFLLINILKEFDADDIVFSDECLKYIISHYSEEQGVRELKRKIKDIVSKINLIKLSDESLFSLDIDKSIFSTTPINVTVELAKKLLE
jgi:ATP-dependent Lon protease